MIFKLLVRTVLHKCKNQTVIVLPQSEMFLKNSVAELPDALRDGDSLVFLFSHRQDELSCHVIGA